MALRDKLKPLPAADNVPFRALCADLPAEIAGALKSAAPTLGPVLSDCPYLLDLARHEAGFLAVALGKDCEPVLARLIADARAAGQGGDRDGLMHGLRIAKARVALLTALAEAGGAIGPDLTTATLSDLADAALDATLDMLMQEAAAKGQLVLPPDRANAANCGLTLFALGKHGGRELNYSSDIDIVAFFDPQKQVLADPGDATRFYTRLVRNLVAIMEDRTADGYVFRTDLRLRPDPGSTPVALSVDAAMVYYEARGQNWERAAWIKARAAAGDKAVGEAFLKEMAPFVWRKHLDFATIADIQAMKRQINISRNVGEARVAGHNVKLGRGGIREIEFFTQTQQLIAGGRDKALRVKPTAQALAALAGANWISAETAENLTRTYWFLRAVENRVQMRRDEQTHQLPEEEADLAAIARLMGYETVEAFSTAYRAVLASVSAYYAELFTEGESLAGSGGDLVFTGSDDDPGTLDTLAEMGFADPKTVSATVRKWHYGSYAATRTGAARAHLTELLPALLETVAEAGSPDDTLQRFDRFLSRMPAGVQFFSLLRANPGLRAMLVALMASAPRMADAVIQRAHVMDGLIDPGFADAISRPEMLVAKVDAFLSEARSFEDLIDRARIIGQEQKFLVCAGLVGMSVTADRAGQQFTILAETLLARLFAAVRAEFEKRHGAVPGARAALVAFGKMASREMTVTSDLDFILLYDSPEGAEESDGGRPLAISQYFIRLTQRLVAALAAPTAEGVLYEADMRLRPSGNSGPLATTLKGFATYQHQDAWTWEHLALARARVVYADAGLADAIRAEIEDVFAARRDRQKQIDDIVAMRELMARERPPRHPFDLKLMPGGMVDLEFIAQSAQLLLRARLDDPFAPPAGILRQLEAVALLPEGARLAEIHATYSTILQAMSACLIDPLKAEGWTDAFRELLARLTNYPDFSRLEADLKAMSDEVRTAAHTWYARLRVE